MQMHMHPHQPQHYPLLGSTAARCARPLVHDGALHHTAGYARPRFQSNSNIRYHPTSSSTCRSTRTRTRCRTIRTPCRSPCSSTRTRTEISAELFCNSYQMLAVCILFSGFLSATHAQAFPLQHPHHPHTRTCFSEPAAWACLPAALSPTLKHPHQVRHQAPASNNNSSSMAGGSSFKVGCRS